MSYSRLFSWIPAGLTNARPKPVQRAGQGTLAAHLLCAGILLAAGFSSTPVDAADHGDAPLISNDQGADIADIYAFVDPNDNNFLVTIITARGFITPGEAENLGFFQDRLNWRFAFEITGDADADLNAHVRFSARGNPQTPQTATIMLQQAGQVVSQFDAPTTLSLATTPVPPPFIVTTDPTSNISVFAGMVDDPFFFDVPAELQFRESLRSGSPNPDVFNRGIDTFAGFNVMSVALRIPLALLGGPNQSLGVSGYTEPTQFTLRSRPGGVRQVGRFINVDRMGIPLVNSALLPYPMKDMYNAAGTQNDADLVFASEISDTLESLNTNAANIGILIGLAVQNGDFLRLDTTIRNTGPQGGIGPGGFPNGRRLADDAVDIIVNVMSNDHFQGEPVDNVNQNDRQFLNSFPFLAPPHQPVFAPQ